MVEHELLILAIQERWPDLVHGRDFWVAHPLDPATGEQSSDAFIAEWKCSVVPPYVGDLLTRAEQLRPIQAASKAREKRDTLLAASDWTQASDAPTDTRETWAAYRQALREIPQQPEFPMNIEWPVPPSNDVHRR
ncbi:hypothetical protein WS86_11760 [Burkholderia savannae]|uniref:tail fiber assembly protein n=1 Tax=Burkholderia savannae TaxID=1637837 RepID=UPI00075F2D39|nr:tail fiber assembly protein [Burkholderia savannae]AOJ80945.1 hypothetical protein WS86_10175 [Burkholderia savannae]AOJ81219.1 hypothetical protein WS86_11760 [Burkholderia savannae]